MVATFRFLFDECLSPALVPLANSLGFDATHILYLDRAGDSDRLLTALAIDRDYVFVTNKRADFLRLYRDQPVHCGLVIILPSVDKVTQQRLFSAFAAALPTLGDLMNKRVEIDADARIEVSVWPPANPNDSR